MTVPILDSWKEIILGGMPIPLMGPLPDNNLVTYPRRLVIGDPGLDGNPLMSALVLSDFSGGNGVEDINESTDTTRYLISSLYTRYPKMLSKPYKVDSTLTQTGTANLAWRFLGDLKVSGTWYAIVAAGTGGSNGRDVSSLPYGGSLTSEGTLTAVPVNTSTVFRGTGTNDKLFIPMGASGYATVEATAGFTFANVAADATHPALVHAATLGYRLVGIDVDGVMWYTTDGSSWTEFGANANLPTSEEPRKLIPYINRDGQPALFILTDTRIVQFDEDGPLIFDVEVSFPPHPYAANGATRWNGDLYFSVGMGISRYTGGSVSPMGLNRDSGLPTDYLGHVTDLVAGANGLYAAVLSDSGNESSIHEYNQNGWHMIWEGPSKHMVPYSMGISRSGNEYSLYWGTSNSSSAVAQGLRRIDLPIDDANPRNISQITSSAFDGGRFRLVTGIYDMSMRGVKKLMSALDVTIQAIPANARLDVYYRTTGFEEGVVLNTFTLLGTIRDAGSHHLQFGEPDNHDIYPGILAEKIQFYFDLVDSSNDPFFMESAVLAFVKMVAPSNSWTVQVDLSKNHAGRSPDVLLQFLYDKLNERKCLPMVHRGQIYRVMISQFSGTTETGSDERSFRTLSLLEIPDGLDIE